MGRSSEGFEGCKPHPPLQLLEAISIHTIEGPTSHHRLVIYNRLGLPAQNASIVDTEIRSYFTAEERYEGYRISATQSQS